MRRPETKIANRMRNNITPKGMPMPQAYYDLVSPTGIRGGRWANLATRRIL
jgi:hypothetical protein